MRLILDLIIKFLAVTRQRLLHLLKAFPNRRDCHGRGPAFKSGGRYAARFSNEYCSLATYLLDFKTGEIAP